MPLYNYQAIDNNGKKRSGFIEAQNEREAKALLREQSILVTQLFVKTQVSRRENLRGEQLLTFTMQLSQLLSAGVPLYESLVTLEEQYRQEAFHRILLSLCEKIKAGGTLSEAMSSFPESFDKLYRAMIAAGESVGALDIVLDRLCHLLAKQVKLKNQITTAMIYPAILASFSLLIIGVLLGFVVPSIEGIFADRPLNGFTSFVLGLSRIARDYWWVYIPLMIGLSVYAFFKVRSEAGRLWLERNLLRVPLIRNLIIQAAVARFCRTMGTLQEGGLPIIDSLRNARKVMRNIVLEEEIEQAETKIIEGSSLSTELSHSKLIPTIVPRMLAVGEESGNLVVMLNKLADMYEDELEKTLNRVMALSQPVILIFMGTMIGTILLAILLPLTDVSSLTM